MFHYSGLTPTSDSYGWKEYWYCNNCGRYYLDAEMTIYTDLAGVYLPALS